MTKFTSLSTDGEELSIIGARIIREISSLWDGAREAATRCNLQDKKVALHYWLILWTRHLDSDSHSSVFLR